MDEREAPTDQVRGLEAHERAAVIAEAKTWLGTPFAHRSMVKGAGVDCAQLVRLVFIECGVLSHAGITIDDEHVLHAFADNGHVTIDAIRMGRLSVTPGPKGGVPRPVKY